MRLSISRTGELGVDPAGELLVREHLAADVAATASFVVRNQTGATVAVAIRANSSFGDLDDALSLRMTARGRTWFLGSLGRLKRGSSASVVLAPAAEARVDLRVWLEPAAKREYQGRAVDVALLLRSRPADGGR